MAIEVQLNLRSGQNSPLSTIEMDQNWSAIIAGFNQAISGAGSVLSVSASVPTGLSVAVTNPTTTPNIAITTTLSGFIKGNGSGFTAQAAISLATDVTGTLPIARGGTNNTTFTTDTALVFDGTKIASSGITTTKLNYLSDVTSAIQAQIDGKKSNFTILPYANGGTNFAASSRQSLIDNLTDVASATLGWVLQKDGSGNAVFAAPPAAAVSSVNSATGAVVLTVSNTSNPLAWTTTDLNIPTADAGTTGLLSAFDWNRFNALAPGSVAFLDGGNAVIANASLGTTTNFSLSFLANNVSVATFSNAGVLTITPPATSSVASSFLVTAGAQTQSLLGSGLDVNLFSATYNQTGTANSTDIAIRRTDTALGSGEHSFMRFYAGASGTTEKLRIANTGNIVVQANWTVGVTSGASIQLGSLATTITAPSTSSVASSFIVTAGTQSQSSLGSGLDVNLFQATYNQTSTANSTDIAIRRTETALGSGVHSFLRLYGGAAGTTEKLRIVNDGNFVVLDNWTVTNASSSTLVFGQYSQTLTGTGATNMDFAAINTTNNVLSGARFYAANANNSQIVKMAVFGQGSSSNPCIGTTSNSALDILTNNTTWLSIGTTGDIAVTQGVYTQTKTAITANAVTAGINLVNGTAATNGNQQYSPYLYVEGKGFGTGANTSQSVAYRGYVIPVQAATNPTGYFTLECSVNGGAFSTSGFKQGSTGAVTIGNSTTFTNTLTVSGINVSQQGQFRVMDSGNTVTQVTLWNSTTELGVFYATTSDSTFHVGTIASAALIFETNNFTERWRISGAAGYYSNTGADGTAYIHLKAPTTAAAQIRLVPGVAPSSPNDGDIYYIDTIERLMFYKNATASEIIAASAVTTESVASDTTFTFTFNGVSYKLLGRA